MFLKFIAIVLLLSSMNANAFLVSDTAGKRVDVSDLAGDGRWMVVMLWQLQCVLCEEQKPSVEAFHLKYKDSKAHVVGLVMDGHDYMPQIKQFIQKKPTKFPSHVVFSDVFSEQIQKETGKAFYTAPGYLVYAPNGELVDSFNSRININQLISYLETQFK